MNRYGEFERLPVGTGISRYIKMLGRYNGDFVNAAAAAEVDKRLDDTPGVSMSLKAGAAFVSNPLVPSGLQREFFELFRSASIFGTLRDRFSPGVFTNFLVPTLIESDSPISGAWVSQSGPSPICVIPEFGEHRMKPHKISFIIVFNDEILKDATLGSGRVVSRILARTTASAIDSCFLSDAAPTDDSPAGICFDAPSVNMTGSSKVEIQTALSDMCEKLETWRDPIWFMSPAVFSRLALQETADFTGERGRLCGYDVVTTTCTDKIILADVGSVLLADDGVSTIDYSNDANISAEVNGETKRVLLFQDGQSAFRITRTINWYRPRESSVVWCNVVSSLPSTPEEEDEEV